MSSWNPGKIDPQSNRTGAYDFAGNCSGCTGKRYFGRKSYRDFGPRIGLAYQLGKNWTIRAAYGLYFAPEMFDTPEGGSPLAKATNVQAGGTFQLEPNPVQPWAGRFNWDNGFPGDAYVPAARDVSWGNRNRPGMIDPQYGRTGYTQNWNLNIQRQLPARIVLDAGYIGNKATGFKNGLLANLNQLPAAVLSDFGARLGNAVTSSESAAASGVAYPYTGFRGTVASALRHSQWNGAANRVNIAAGGLRVENFDKRQINAANNASPSNTFLVKNQFSNPLPNTLGTASRTTACAREGAALNEDISIIKNTYFGENFRLQIRADMMNLLNRSVPVGIITNVTSPLFGQATGRGCVVGPGDASRTLQFGVRLDFQRRTGGKEQCE